MNSKILFLGDAACLAAFVLVGMRGHDTLAGQNAALRIAINLGPLLLAWTLAALAVGAFRVPLARHVTAPAGAATPARAARPGSAPLQSLLARTLLAWLVAAPLGLLLRAFVLRSSILAVAFVVVTLALGGALLLGWRTLYYFLARRRAANPDIW